MASGRHQRQVTVAGSSGSSSKAAMADTSSKQQWQVAVVAVAWSSGSSSKAAVTGSSGSSGSSSKAAVTRQQCRQQCSET